MNERKNIISSCERIVLKVGTRLLTDERRIPVLAGAIAALRALKKKIILVSSGAVGLGMKELGLEKRPVRLARIQAMAALGQSRLMGSYAAECGKYGFKVAQLLLTADDLRNRGRHLNVLNCIHSLWQEDILPIVNENDSVSIDELKFGDNDVLAALLAAMTRSELTVILTTEDGLRYRNADGSLGERISEVAKLDAKVKGMAKGTDNSHFSIGGMSSKLKAAEIVTSAGEYLWIADGREDDILERIFKSKDVGTLFIPGKNSQMQSRKRWIKFFSRCDGTLVIDDGAVKALLEKGRSLLPSGIVEVKGAFKRGSTLEITDLNGRVVARGLSNFNNRECEKIAGMRSEQATEALGRSIDTEVIHRDNLTIVR